MDAPLPPAARRSWWRAAAGVAVLAAFVVYALTQREDVLAAWRQVRAPYLALLGLPAFGVLWAHGKVFQRSCRELGVVIGERETLALAVLNTAGNYLGGLRLGVVAKMMYVKRTRGIALTESAAIAIGGAAVALATSIFCGVVLILLLPVGRRAGLPVVAALLAIGAALLLMLLGPHALLDAAVGRLAPGVVRERLAHFARAWRIVGRPSLVWALALWQVVIHAIAALGFYIGFAVLLDRPFGFSSALAFTIVTGLASIAAFTPGNIGLQELIIVAIADALRLGEGAGVVVAAALRVAQILVIAAPLGRAVAPLG